MSTHTIQMVTSMITLLTLTACGGSGYPTSTTSRTSYKSPSGSTSGSTTGSGGLITINPISLPATSTSTNPPVRFNVVGTGYNAYSFPVNVRRVLRVRFTAQMTDRTATGTGFTPPYSKLWVYIKAGNADAQPTSMLNTGLVGSAQTSHVFELSGSFEQQCSDSDTKCRQSVMVTVQQPNYDYGCYNWGMYCPGTNVYSTHPWNGVLEVQTDDTAAL